MGFLNSRIVICKGIRQDKEYTNVYDGDMLAVCNNSDHYVDRRNSYSFIRDDGSISTDFSYSAVLQCNYMAFQNPDYDNKWFFAWIDRVEYKGEKNIRIHYTLDYWSTWWSDFRRLPVFVEREHVNDDTRGLNLVAEPIANVETIPGTQEGQTFEYYYNDMTATLYLYRKQSELGYVEGSRIDNTFLTPLDFQTFPINETGATNLAYEMDALAGNYDGVVGISVYPTTFTTPKTKDGAVQQMELKLQQAFLNEIRSHDGYVPVNQKLYTYPYYYMDVDNGREHSIWKFEHWDFIPGSELVHEARAYGSNIVPTGEVICGPYNYMGETFNAFNSISLRDFPQIPFCIDSYKAWLAQKSNSALLQGMTSTLISAGAGAISGGPMGALMGAGAGMAKATADILSQQQQALDASDGVRGASTGSILTIMGNCGWRFKTMTLHADIARSIDQYFSMFGYQVNRVKHPNCTGRTYWNYVKINGNGGWGNMPEEAREKINAILNKGVTIWHQANIIGSYYVGGPEMQNPILP